jgi:hypothetical protein
MAVKVSNRPWSSIKESDYPDANSFCKACLIDLNPPGKDKVKDLCKLPVKEPNGTLNRNAVHAAAAALAGARTPLKVPSDKKKKAARRLIRIYLVDLKETPPESLYRIAGLPVPKRR